MSPSFSLDWKGWIYANLLQKKPLCYATPWNVVFSFVCWFLWKWRCKCYFDNSFNMPYDIKDAILSYLEEWKAAAMKAKGKGRKQEVKLCWSKPPKSIFKINVDGARNREGIIGAGGVLRDCSGAWCAGFLANLGTGDVLQAEAWALYHGLQMGISEKVMQVVVETDSAVLVNLVLNADISVHPLGTIVQNCRNLMSGFVTCSINHVMRGKNHVADILAKFSLGCSLGTCYMKEAPACCVNAVLDDLCGKGEANSGHDQSMIHDGEDRQDEGMECADVGMRRHMRAAVCSSDAVSVLHTHNDASLSRLYASSSHGCVVIAARNVLHSEEADGAGLDSSFKEESGVEFGKVDVAVHTDGSQERNAAVHFEVAAQGEAAVTHAVVKTADSMHAAGSFCMGNSDVPHLMSSNAG